SGDFNKDTYSDFAVATTNGLTVLLGKSDGTFMVGATKTVPAGIPQLVAVGNFTTPDSNLDILVTVLNGGGTDFYLYEGNGTGTSFVGGFAFNAGGNVYSVATGDFDTD